MPSQQRGFTLMEMLLVLAIMVALAGMAMPSLQRTLDRQQLISAADLLRSKCGSARVLAMRSGQIQMLRVELGAAHYQLQPWSAGDEALNASEQEAFKTAQNQGGASSSPMKTLPEGITFHSSESPFDTRAAKVEEELLQLERGQGKWSQPVLFYPDGATSAATIVLANAREQAMPVKLRSLTGQCTVGEITTLAALLEEQP